MPDLWDDVIRLLREVERKATASARYSVICQKRLIKKRHGIKEVKSWCEGEEDASQGKGKGQ